MSFFRKFFAAPPSAQLDYAKVYETFVRVVSGSNLSAQEKAAILSVIPHRGEAPMVKPASLKMWALPSEARALRPYVGKKVTLALEEVPSEAFRMWDLRTYRLILT